MKEHFLFIDTEASGLPKKWDLPYDAPSNWPYAVQVSWVIYTKDGKKIKEENYYISDNYFKISAGALRIHGLTNNFLQQNGMSRRKVLTRLSEDLQQFQPMIVGHFVELDYHVLGAGYYREGLKNPIPQLPVFCIMLASQHLQQNPFSKFLRLGDLYSLLFKKPLLSQHNAMADAAATADCFFELVKRKEITSFAQPPIVFKQQAKTKKTFTWAIAFLLLFISIILIVLYYG